MTDHSYGRTQSRMQDVPGSSKNVGEAAAEMAHEVADQAKRAASDAAATVTHQVKELLERQVGTGAETVVQLAGSAKRAATDLDRSAPQLAGLVRTFADKLERYADDLRDQSVDELIRTASDFTRRQPALVFGMAALAGYFVFRTLKSTPSVPSPSIQPTHDDHTTGGRQFHGP